MSGDLISAPLLIGKGRTDGVLYPKLANRHGLISGATGTGKTISLQVLAERLSDIGVPVFLADVKGALSGMAKVGAATPKVAQRVKELGLGDHRYSNYKDAIEDVIRK